MKALLRENLVVAISVVLPVVVLAVRLDRRHIAGR